MVDTITEKRLTRELQGLYNKYNLYVLNRSRNENGYKLPSNQNYLDVQQKLAIEIELSEKSVKDVLSAWLKENYKEIELIAYDSRCIHHTKVNGKMELIIGKVLLKNVKDEQLVEDISVKFYADFHYFLIINLFENLSEEVQEQFTK